MAATTVDRNTPTKDGVKYSYPVAAATKINAGSLVALNASGLLVPMSVATTQKCVGRAEFAADNTSGAASAIRCETKRGVFPWGQTGGAITLANVGDTVYAADDQTVTLTSTGASIVGTVKDVDSFGVWVGTP